MMPIFILMIIFAKSFQKYYITEMKIKQPKLSLIISFVALAVVFRIIPHWPNFTPVGAIALLSGALISGRILAFAIPFLAIVISDLLTVLLINYQYTTPVEYFSNLSLIFLYLAYAIMVLIGMGISNKLKWPVIGIASLSTATIFFLLSNFGYWLTSSLPKTLSGLGAAYVSGLPFYLNNLLGDLFYTFVMFGSVAFLTDRFPELQLKSK